MDKEYCDKMLINREKTLIKQHSEPTLSNFKSNKLQEFNDSCSFDEKIINVTFKLSKQGEYFERSFKPSYTILRLKEKLAKQFKISVENLIMSKDASVISDHVQIGDFKNVDSQLTLELSTEDDTFIDTAALKEAFNETISVTSDKGKERNSSKKVPPIATCKFNVIKQYHSFTKSYPSSSTVNYVKDDICSIFMIESNRIVMINNKYRLEKDVPLSNLAMDNFGNLEIVLFTNDGSKFNFNLLYKDAAPITDILSVTVPKGDNSFVNINVEVIDARMIKPYLGGYRNKETGLHYHHAFSQTPQKKEKVPAELKNCRDTQTAYVKTKAIDTTTTRATQMTSKDIYIPNIDDKIIAPKPYESYDQMMARLNPNEKAIIIQRAWRAYRYRMAVEDWLKRCLQRIQDLKNEELDEAKAKELRLRQDIVKKTFPRTREDFDQLYAMVDRWRNSEIARISKLHTKGPKIAEFCLLLDKEIEMLRSIEKFRSEVRRDHRILKEKNLLDEMSKPTVWKTAQGFKVTMDTIEAQHARYLRELYYSFSKTDMKVEERMELLVNFKTTLKNYSGPLVEQLESLIDRECDLMVRNIPSKDIELLRKRIQALVFKFIQLPEFNKESFKRDEIKKHNRMKEQRLYLCKECNQVKTYRDFPLHSRTQDMEICTSCLCGNSTNNVPVEMIQYTYILRAVRREERRKRCWSSLAFVLQDDDIFFLVEKIWHSRSALSESFDIGDLRLCRWKVHKDWAPWNCILLTLKEMKSHLKLEKPEEVYDSDLVRQVHNKHLLARAHFSTLTGANSPDSDDDDIGSLPTTDVGSTN